MTTAYGDGESSTFRDFLFLRENKKEYVSVSEISDTFNKFSMINSITSVLSDHPLLIW